MERTLQHACFQCRKVFKKTIHSKETEAHRDSYILDEEKQIEFKCPDCGGRLNPMGKTFRAPKKSDVEEWGVIEELYRNGFRFIGSGFGSSTPLPTKQSDLKQFLKENPVHPLKIK